MYVFTLCLTNFCICIYCTYSWLLFLILQLAEKRMLVNTSVDVFKDFINQTICVVLDPRLEDHEEGSEAISRVNVVLGKVLLSGHLTNTIW